MPDVATNRLGATMLTVTFRTNRLFAGCLAFSLAFSSVLAGPLAQPARSSEHAVEVIANNPAELLRLRAHLPSVVSDGLNSSAVGLVGPLQVAVDQNQPLGIWLDWTSEDAPPETVVFVRNPAMHQLDETLESNAIARELVSRGIYKLELQHPLYYRQSGDWLYVSHSLDAVESVRQAPQFDSQSQHPLNTSIQLTKIPASVRGEVAKVLALRCLPTEIATARELSSDLLVQMFVNRLFESISQQGEEAHLGVANLEAGISVSIDVDGRKLLQPTSQFSRLFFEGGLSTTQARNHGSVYTRLTEREVGMLSWWAQSLAEQVRGDVQSANIKDREGSGAVVEIAKEFSRLIAEVAISGEIETCFAFVGDEEELPILGVAVPDAQRVWTTLEKLSQQTALEQLGIIGMEPRFKSVSGFDLHRFTIGESGEDASYITVAVGEKAIFVTAGTPGLKALEALLAAFRKDARAPQPLNLRLDNFPVANLFGWKAPADKPDENNAPATIASRYTDDGFHIDVIFSADE